MDSEDGLVGLDISWLKEQERLEKVNNNYEKEPMENIELYFIFINQNSFIEKITNERLDLDCKTGIISKADLHSIIEKKQSSTWTLDDVMLFHVNLEPQNIHSYSKSDDISNGFVQVLKTVDNDIHIPPSIFIFHRINSIFFTFKQKPSVFIPESIIKKHAGKSTKKVRIEFGLVERAIQNNKKRMTRRNVHR